MPDHPLGDTLSRCSGLLEHTHAMLGPPGDGDWTSYGSLLDQDAVRARLNALSHHYAAPAALAAQFLTGWVGAVVTRLPAAAVFAERRLPLLQSSDLWLRSAVDEQTPDVPGWFDAFSCCVRPTPSWSRSWRPCTCSPGADRGRSGRRWPMTWRSA